VIWQIAARRSTYKKLGKRSVLYKAKRKIEKAKAKAKAKAQVRAKVAHPFRMVKRQFGFVKTRFRGLAKKHRATGDAIRASALRGSTP
jgi:IS5 family transposase